MAAMSPGGDGPAEGPGLLYVVPRTAGRSAGVEAGLLASAAFATAMGRRLGGADLLTPEGLRAVEEAEEAAIRVEYVPSAGRAAARRLPTAARLAIGDLRAWRQAVRLRRDGLGSRPAPYRLVVQSHHRFQDWGLRLARRLGVPFVLRVDALEVTEQETWGLRRPGWGGLVTRLGEVNIMRRADLVASVSEELDAQLGAAGVPAELRTVIPNGVDVRSFRPGPPDRDLLRSHGLEGRFVVGWVGGFRPFHGLEIVPSLVRALRERVPEAVVCLVGDGPERERFSNRVAALGDAVRLVPAAAHGEVPRWLRSFDVCLALGARAGFHYSPMKLYEYLACGRPVVATAAGQMAEVLTDGEDALLVPGRDPEALAEAVARLAMDPGLGRRIGSAGRALVERSGSWDARARTLIDELARRSS